MILMSSHKSQRPRPGNLTPGNVATVPSQRSTFKVEQLASCNSIMSYDCNLHPFRPTPQGEIYIEQTTFYTERAIATQT